MRLLCRSNLASRSTGEAPIANPFNLGSSPQGRIFQVEYAQEAVKQGSVVVGLVNKTHAVLVGLKVRIILGIHHLD
jgi:hypothetical protein